MAARPDLYPFEADLHYFDTIVSQAQQTLLVQIEAAMRQGELGNAARRRAQLASIDRVLAELSAVANPLASKMVRDAWHQGAGRALKQIHDLPIEAPEQAGAFTGVSREAVKTLQDSLSQRLDSAQQTLGRRVQDIYAREQRAASLRAILGAEGSPHAASKHLQSQLLKDRDIRRAVQEGGTGFVDSSGRRWSLDTYANMATRTVTREAVVQGAMARMASHGIAVARVSTHASSCPICEPFEGTLVAIGGSDITEYRGEAVSDTGEVPPYHPNMVPVGTLVQPVGRLRAGVRANWRGPLVDVTTASGIRLAIGPNHPVLTPRGWLPAKRLGRGDYVLRGGSGERGGSWTGAGENLDQPPARVEDVFDSLSATGVLARLVATTDHLHGDGGFCEGEIDVVRADGELWNDLDVELGEHPREHALVGAGMEHTSLPSTSPSGLRLVSVGGAVGRPLPDVDPTSAEPTQERRPRNWQSARQLLGALACNVTADEIVDVRNVDWAGQAFDLETSEGSYFANGVYVSNCAHSLEPISATIDSVREELETAVV